MVFRSVKSEGQKRGFVGAEIAILAVATALILIPNYGAHIVWLMGHFVEVHIHETLPTALYFVIVLVVNIAWIVLNVKWPLLKNIYVRIFLVWLVFMLSVMLMYCLVGLDILSNAFA